MKNNQMMSQKKKNLGHLKSKFLVSFFILSLFSWSGHAATPKGKSPNAPPKGTISEGGGGPDAGYTVGGALRDLTNLSLSGTIYDFKSLPGFRKVVVPQLMTLRSYQPTLAHQLETTLYSKVWSWALIPELKIKINESQESAERIGRQDDHNVYLTQDYNCLNCTEDMAIKQGHLIFHEMWVALARQKWNIQLSKPSQSDVEAVTGLLLRDGFQIATTPNPNIVLHNILMQSGFGGISSSESFYRIKIFENELFDGLIVKYSSSPKVNVYNAMRSEIELLDHLTLAKKGHYFLQGSEIEIPNNKGYRINYRTIKAPIEMDITRQGYFFWIQKNGNPDDQTMFISQKDCENFQEQNSDEYNDNECERAESYYYYRTYKRLNFEYSDTDLLELKWAQLYQEAAKSPDVLMSRSFVVNFGGHQITVQY